MTRTAAGLGLSDAEESAVMVNPDRQPDANFLGLEDAFFFIVGAPRSGTTLLQTVLSRHSKIFIPPETEFFMTFGDEAVKTWGFDQYIRQFLASQRWKDQGLRDSELRAEINRSARNVPTAREVFLAMMTLHARKQGKTRIGEKSPHHCRCVWEILESFPDAKFIHLVRDARDVVASRLRMPWSVGSHLAIAREWRRIMETHHALQGQVPAESYIEVRYESFVAQPEEQTRRICDFLGERFEPEMMAVECGSAPDSRSRAFAAREATWKEKASGEITQASVGAFRRELTPRQIAGIQREAGAQLERAGYELDDVDGRTGWFVADVMDRLGDLFGRTSRSVRKRLH